MIMQEINWWLRGVANLRGDGFHMVFTWLLPGYSYFFNTVRKQEKKGNNSELQQSYQQVTSSMWTKTEGEESAKRVGKGKEIGWSLMKK